MLLPVLSAWHRMRAAGLIGLVAGLLLAVPVRGDDTPVDPARPIEFGLLVEDMDPQTKALFIAAQVGEMVNPQALYLLIKTDESMQMWQNEVLVKGLTTDGKDKPRPAVADPRVDQDLMLNIEDGYPVLNANQNYYEYQAYCYLLRHAHDVPADVIQKNARTDITFVHMFEEPRKYRGEIVRVQGTLRRLYRFDPPKQSMKDGIKDLYEGWILDTKVMNHPPVCVLFTEMPKDKDGNPLFKFGERLNYQVEFDGYFFKKYRYETAEMREGKGNVQRYAPLLIGNTIRPASGANQAEAAGWADSSMFLPLVVMLIGGPIVLAVALSWWFRRGDAQVRHILADTRGTMFVEPGTNGQESFEGSERVPEPNAGTDPSEN